MKLRNLLLIICCFSLCTYNVYSSEQQSQYKTHTVQKSETVYSIASSHNVSVEDIYKLNPEARKGIRTNQTIYIPVKTNQDTDNSSGYVLHSIQLNETLYSVSKKYDISIEDIQAANPGLNSKSFRIGSAIRIPLNTQRASISASTNEIPDGYTIHRVKGKETLYSLSKQYNLSMQEIADINPEIKESGLKKDMDLKIPTQRTTSSANPINNAGYTSVENPTTDYNPSVRQNESLQIGLLLPFLDSKDYMQARFVEYYEGFLLAVDEMKKKGFSADIYVFDIRKGNDTKKLESLLETVEIKNLDLIIGGVTDDEVALLSQFAENNDIKYVVPFPVKNNSIIAGYNTYLANLPQADLYSKVAKKFSTLYKGQNIIVVSDTKNDKDDFITVLKDELKKDYNTTLKTLQVADINTQLKDIVSLSQKNIIVPASSNLIFLSKVIPSLRNMKIQQPSVEIGLFGYPDWQTYYSQFLPDFYNFDSYIYSPFYADNNDSKVQDFHQKFRKWYNKTLINTYPKYGLLGYDTALYFLTALAEEKESYEQDTRLMRTGTLQSTFYFERTNNQKGYVNTGLFFIHFDPITTTIEKIDHSR